jgi:hypothetical protein
MRPDLRSIALVAILLVACSSSSTTTSGPPGSPSDPLGCGLPSPCDTGVITTTSTEMSTLQTAQCIYTALAAAKPTHLVVELSDVVDSFWDFYWNGTDPAVIVETRCEIKGPCSQQSVKRCALEPASQIDCSHGSGPSRVCNAPINWCSSSADVQPVCP